MRDHQIEKTEARIESRERIAKRIQDSKDKINSAVQKEVSWLTSISERSELESDMWNRWGQNLLGVGSCYNSDLRRSIEIRFSEIDSVKESLRTQQTEGRSLGQLEKMRKHVAEYLSVLDSAIESRKQDSSDEPEHEDIGGFGSQYDYPDLGDLRGG